MKSLSLSQTPKILCFMLPIWIRWCSIPILMASIGLLLISLSARNSHIFIATSLVPPLVIALCFAIFLNICSFLYIQREHREADQAFRNTDCEFLSIFQNVLDGILIVNNKGNCTDANPAAAAILRLSTNDLIGQNISHFLADRDGLSESWSLFLQNKSQRGRAQLTAGDGAALIVDFTAAANYLPGRHVLIICDVTERTLAETSLRRSEERFRHMANNIQEVFWMMDAETHEITYINPAYATITGHSVESLRQNPSSYRELIHAEDRIRVLSKLHDLGDFGILDEEFRFIRADGEVRWAWAKGIRVPTEDETHLITGTVQDITSRKQAEMKISEQLDIVEVARAEAEALRKSTLALSQNLAMDSVLDTLLQCIFELVPFDKATVLFVEGDLELMVAREAPRNVPRRLGLMLDASENVFLQRILFDKKAMLLTNVAKQSEWRDIYPLDHFRSWLGVPLIAAGRVLGILSLGSNTPSIFTAEHLRLARSLAVPAAVAIQNARTHERAEIYAAELVVRLGELRQTQKALPNIEKRTLRPDAL
jgi:PAS domain S-box-containing protein